MSPDTVRPAPLTRTQRGALVAALDGPVFAVLFATHRGEHRHYSRPMLDRLVRRGYLAVRSGRRDGPALLPWYEITPAGRAALTRAGVAVEAREIIAAAAPAPRALPIVEISGPDTAGVAADALLGLLQDLYGQNLYALAPEDLESREVAAVRLLVALLDAGAELAEPGYAREALVRLRRLHADVEAVTS